MSSTVHHDLAPSDWVIRFGVSVSSGGRVLDVACGAGRHANWFVGRGHIVNAVDKEKSPKLSAQIAFKQADIEVCSWPYEDELFAAVIVTNYLHRALLKILVDSVAEDGWLIYETFAAGNEQFGRPSRPDFLLQPGELLEAVRGKLQVVAYEHGFVDTPKPAIVQRIAAQNLID